MDAPTREEVKAALFGLVSGELTREQVADWASRWVFADDPEVGDSVVWDALEALSGADLRTDPNSYLHTEPDFHAWLDHFEQATEE